MSDNRLNKITNSSKQQEFFYSDFFTNFNNHPNTGYLVRLTNEESIKRALRNLLLTNRTERRFQPQFGGDLHKLLFEDISPITSNLIQKSIEDTISRFEPRIKLINVTVIPNEQRNSYEVGIIFQPINISTQSAMTVTLYRVR